MDVYDLNKIDLLEIDDYEDSHSSCESSFVSSEQESPQINA